MIEPIKTRQLRLESLSVEFLQALIDEDMERARELVPFHILGVTSLAGQAWVSRRLKTNRPIVRRGQALHSDNYNHLSGCRA